MAGQLLIFVDDLERVDSENQTRNCLAVCILSARFFITPLGLRIGILGLNEQLKTVVDL